MIVNRHGCANPLAPATPRRPISPTGWCVRWACPSVEAHHVTGRIVNIASERGVGLDELKLADLQGVEPRITQDVFGVLGVDKSVAKSHELRRRGAGQRPRASGRLAEAAGC